MDKLTTLDDMSLGRVMAESGYFADARQAGQALVKILAGRELGFGPVASMTGINIIRGRITLSANLIAAAVQRSGRYEFRVREMSNDNCTIEFFDRGESIGVSEFSMMDAKMAGLTGDNWRKYPRNMLYARSMSNGARWFCPDVFGGPIYTPDELDSMATIDEGSVTVDSSDVNIVPVQQEENNTIQRPYDPDTLRAGIAIRAGKNMRPASRAQRTAARLAVMSLVLNDEGNYRRVLQILTGKTSSTELTSGEASALIEWSGTMENDEYQPRVEAIKEAALLLRQLNVEAGQQSLFGGDEQHDPDTDAAMA